MGRIPPIDPTDGDLPDIVVDRLAARMQTPGDVLEDALATVIAAIVIDREMLNVLDYGVERGTSASQTAAIKAALDANPGKAFYFPPGDYRLDTELVVSAENILVGGLGARLYAGAAMTTLVTYYKAAAGYAEDKAIVGFTLDGNLLANRILSIGKVIRFTLTQTTFINGVHRGLITEAGVGAELFAYDLRFHNTTISNVADNIAIEANMGDSHFRDIVMRDWTVGVKDTAANRWTDVHPWIGPNAGAVTQMTSRYPASVGFDVTGMSDMIRCLSDTMRYAFKFRTNGTSYTAPPRLLNCRATWSASTLPDALATANPAYVFDNSDSVGAIVDRQTVTGHSVVPGNFLLGGTANLTARNTFSYGYIKGYSGSVGDPLEYRSGMLQGVVAMTPTLIGSSVAGSPSYSSRSARMVADGELVTYSFSIAATLDATIGGNLRIGGLTLPDGATNCRTGTGEIAFAAGVDASSIINWAGTSLAPTPLKRDASGYTIEIPVTALRNTVVQIHGKFTVSAYKA